MANTGEKDSKGNGRWTKLEHQRFLLGLELFGKNWKKIQELIGTRTGSQIRSHAQKFFLKNKAQTDDHILVETINENNQSTDSMTVIKSNYSKNLEQNEQYSCYMKQIIKVTLEHKNFNFWDQFIDINCCRNENQFLVEDSIVRKGSFVIFDNCNHTKQDTVSPYLSIIG